MIHVFAKKPYNEAAKLVSAALRRSVSYGLVTQAAPACLEDTAIAVAIQPDESTGHQLWSWLNKKPRKLIVFGALPVSLHSQLDVQLKGWPASAEDWSKSKPAPSGNFAESSGSIQYRENASIFDASHWERSLERFDFTDEWNNLAYGAIRADQSIWAIQQPLRVSAKHTLADLVINGETQFTYAAIFTAGDSSVLWFNRPVGPIDSFEWRLIEQYLSNWQSEYQPCCPVISEIPWGYDSAITMRLDCDEDITSARPLWLAYREMEVPLSLAIHTANLNDNTHQAFLTEYTQKGGVLLSHTASHAPNWGGSYKAAYEEGRESFDLIYKSTGISAHYAVSPFHQSPPYALEGLCDAGYLGCIGGIIRNDPEFLLARGGELVGLPRGFIGHSQQTMLHGDCLLEEGDPLRIFKAAYDRARETRTLFGYLDHPFSERYQYGWKDEGQRIEAHQQFVRHIQLRASKPLFFDENQAMNFLRAKATIEITKDGDKFCCKSAKTTDRIGYGVEYKGQTQQLKIGTTLI